MVQALLNSSHVCSRLVLADGAVFDGYSFGHLSSPSHVGEVVFNTSMVGYQETLTDPSYAGQLLCFTAPQIGNVGCNPEDNESSKVRASAVIVKELSTTFSNYRAVESFEAFCLRHGLPGLFGVDTRALVQHLRDHGAQLGVIVPAEFSLDQALRVIAADRLVASRAHFSRVCCEVPYEWFQGSWRFNEGFKEYSHTELVGRPHLVVMDCGVKYSILRHLTDVGFRVTVVPAFWSSERVLDLKPNAIFISNGPGDPSELGALSMEVKKMIGTIPVFGICLGHQIIAQALGARTFKLQYGHRGANHPVRDLRSNLIEVSVQNHGYAVDSQTLPRNVEVSHINLNDHTIEGIRLEKERVFSVQYHPEASPGPHDSCYIFSEFLRLARVANA